jgi:hypothetical protein
MHPAKNQEHRTMNSFTRKRKVLAGALVAGAIAAIGLVGAVAAFGNDDTTRTPDGDGGNEPVTGSPGTVAPNYDGLHKARLDLAERLGIDPKKIVLRSISHEGWDGCLGIYVEGQACTMIFVGGTVAIFDVDGDSYRYHIAGDQIVATDFVEGEIVDGMPLDAELRPDTNALLAAYVRGDLALRLGVDIEDITVEQLQDVTFSNLCLGFLADPEQMCAEALAKGAIVILGYDGESFRYHVSAYGIVAVSFEEGETTIDLDQDTSDVQEKIRKDLAKRLGVDLEKVSVLSFRSVQWPDGCQGVYFKDALCSQAIVDGFIATVGVAGDDKAYTYHGAGQEFTGIDFLDPDEFRLGQPLPEEDE